MLINLIYQFKNLLVFKILNKSYKFYHFNIILVKQEIKTNLLYIIFSVSITLKITIILIIILHSRFHKKKQS